MNIVCDELEESLNIKLLTYVCNKKYEIQRGCFPQLLGQIPTKHFFINFGCISFNFCILNNIWREILNKYIASKCIMGNRVLFMSNMSAATLCESVAQNIYVEMKNMVFGDIKIEEAKIDDYSDLMVKKSDSLHFVFTHEGIKSDVIFYFGKADDIRKNNIVNNIFFNKGFNDIIVMQDESISYGSNLYKFIYENFCNMMSKNELCMYFNGASNNAIFK